MSNQIDTLIHIGDSISDDGAFFDYTARYLRLPLPFPVPFPLPPGPAFLGEGVVPYAGVFSNGPVYTQTLAGLLGLSDEQVAGYSIGGARLLGDRPISATLGEAAALLVPGAPGDFNINYTAQVERVLTGAAIVPEGEVPAIDPNLHTAALINIGANDLGDFVAETVGSGSIPTLAQGLSFAFELSQTHAAGVLALAQSGLVDQIILVELPPIDFFPVLPGTPQEAIDGLNAVIDVFNVGLQLTALQAEALGVETDVIRLNALTEEIDRDLSGFGFLLADIAGDAAADGPYFTSLPTSPELTNGQLDFPINPLVDQLGVSAESFKFFDPIHPSTKIHDIFAAFIDASLNSNVSVLNDFNNFRLLGGEADLVLARDGNDTVLLGGGDDIALGGRGNDGLFGGRGNDLIAGGAGNDRLRGDAGNDVLFGGNGNDNTNGGWGHDVIFDGAGNDRSRGGFGNDTFVWRLALNEATTSDRFEGGFGRDKLIVVDGTGTITAGNLGSFGVTTRSIETVVIVNSEEELAAALPDNDLLDAADLWHFA